MNDTASTARLRMIGIVVIAIGVLLLVIAFTDSIPLLGGGGGTTVTARFAQANELDDATPVRIGGVDVGHVSGLRAAPDNTTTVVMQITTSGVHLHTDASARIRWRTLLGGSMYIDLTPGSASAPSLHGAIPLGQTASQVDWDQFNSQLPSTARRQLQRMLAGLSGGVSAPRHEGRLITVAGPTLQTVGESAQALRGQDIGDLSAVVRHAARTLQTVGADSAGLQRFVDGADAALAATATHNAALAQALQLSPPALAATLQTSGVLDRTLTALDPLVAQLAPGAKLLGPTSAVLTPLLARLQTTLHRAVPLLDVAPGAFAALASAGREGVPLIAGLTPVLARSNTNLLPWLARTDPETRLKLYETLGPTASALSSTLSGFDINGFTYNFNVQFATGSVLLPCDIGLSGIPNLTDCLAQTPASALGGGR